MACDDFTATLVKENAELKKQLNVAVRALEYYANKQNYVDQFDGESISPAPILFEEGKTAEAALNTIRQAQFADKIINTLEAKPISVPNNVDGYFKWLKETT